MNSSKKMIWPESAQIHLNISSKRNKEPPLTNIEYIYFFAIHQIIFEFVDFLRKRNNRKTIYFLELFFLGLWKIFNLGEIWFPLAKWQNK